MTDNRDQLLQDASTLLMFANVAAKQQEKSPSPDNVYPLGQASQGQVVQSQASQGVQFQQPQGRQEKHTVFDPVRQIYLESGDGGTAAATGDGARPSISGASGASVPSTGDSNGSIGAGVSTDEIHHAAAVPAAASATEVPAPAPVPAPAAPAAAPTALINSLGSPSLGPPPSLAPQPESTPSAQSVPNTKPSHSRTPSNNYNLLPGPASVTLAGTNNAVIAAAALAQAADNPLPLLKREPSPKKFTAPPLSSYQVSPDSGIIGCICGIEDDDGFTIQCDICYRWQHCMCMDYKTNEEVPEDEYKCYFCDVEKWGKFDKEKCRISTIERLKDDDDDKKRKAPNRLEDKKKRRIDTKEKRKQLRDDFENPPVPDEPPVFVPNKDNDLLEDGVSAEMYQSTYYKLRSNDYVDHTSQRFFELMGLKFYQKYQEMDETSRNNLPIKVVTLKEFKAIKKLHVRLPNHEKYLLENDQKFDLPNYFIRVKPYSDSQKQKFNGISKLSLFLQSDESREEFEDLIPKGTVIIEYFGVLDLFENYRDNKTNQYHIWGTTKPKVLKTSVNLGDKSLDLVLDSRFVGNESRFIRKACPPAVNCDIECYFIPETSSFRFLVVTSKDIKLDKGTPEEELRLPWEWDQTHPIKKLNGDDNEEGLRFDQLNDREKTLSIGTIDQMLYFTECGCSTTSATPLYLPNCAVFKVKKAITYLLRSTRKISGITNLNLYKPRDELIMPKEPKTYVSWQERLVTRDRLIEANLFLPAKTSNKEPDPVEDTIGETIHATKVKKQLSKLDQFTSTEDPKSYDNQVLSILPVSGSISNVIEQKVEHEVQIKPEVQRKLSEIKLKLTDNNLEKINKALNLEVKKEEVSEEAKPLVKKKLSFADYKKKMK